MRKLMMVSFIVVALPSCATLAPQSLHEEEKLTVGTAQREIRIGMSGADVINVLGSPNLVSTDADRNEVWAYDRISTEVVQTDLNAGVWVLGSSALGGASGGRKTDSTSQRTLTIIVRFDSASRVRDFAYHSSRF
jgi:outer membrane protein assembly factor BamE (lipoprotein component of BamABCDE complex)